MRLRTNDLLQWNVSLSRARSTSLVLPLFKMPGLWEHVDAHAIERSAFLVHGCRLSMRPIQVAFNKIWCLKEGV